MPGDRNDIMHIAVLPSKAADADQIRVVASIIGQDLYGTRLLLAGKIPKIIAHYETPEAAESTLQRLRGLGLTVIQYRDSELRARSQGFLANSLQFGEQEITFRNRSGQFVKMDAGDAFLIVVGTMESREDVQVAETKMKLNVPATLLTGGIPIRKKVTEMKVKTSSQTERFIRVFDKTTAESFIDIRQHDFDYSCLSSDMAPSTQANMSILTARIRDAFTQALFDDTLTGHIGSDVPATTPWGKIDALCRLIYRFRQV